MEKKIYITPALKVRKFTPHTILAGSDNNVTVDKTSTTEETLGKQGTGFDWGDTWSNNEESEN